MACSQKYREEVVPDARLSSTRADDPRYLLDDIVARKLSALSAGGAEPCCFHIAGSLSHREPFSNRRPVL